MRLDHLLSKDEEVGVLDTVECFMKGAGRTEESVSAQFMVHEASGADALKGHTRSHPEHDG